jgi:hypothetical protein
MAPLPLENTKSRVIDRLSYGEGDGRICESQLRATF